MQQEKTAGSGLFYAVRAEAIQRGPSGVIKYISGLHLANQLCAKGNAYASSSLNFLPEPFATTTVARPQSVVKSRISAILIQSCSMER
jgi:hypothetical protein